MARQIPFVWTKTADRLLMTANRKYLASLDLHWSGRREGFHLPAPTDPGRDSLPSPGSYHPWPPETAGPARDEVLEIGTGTGWTAGLLASRLGDESVTSMEIDQVLLATATEHLKQAGLFPRLVLGDGAKGRREGAPYDRVHVTCGVREVPYAWVEQTRRGGAIVFPWMPRWAGGHLVKLIAVGDGTAVGGFHSGVDFMLLRSQRWSRPRLEEVYRKSTTYLDPRRVVRSSYGAEVAIAGMLPEVCGTHETQEGRGIPSVAMVR